MRGIWGIDPGWGVTFVRVAMALIFIGAGYGKFASGTEAVAGGFAKMAIPLPGLSAPFIIALELIGGILLLFGIFSRWIGLLFFLEFIVATFYVKFLGPGFNAGRLDLMLLAGGALLCLAGGGRAAVDEFWLEHRAG
jgi:putative oxidoreductase